MQAFLAILRYDVNQLIRSWLVRIWVVALVAPALFFVVVAANEEELASEILTFYVRVVLSWLSAGVVAVIAVQAITGESGVMSDAILSRSVTRTEYISAKIAARLGVTAAVYLAVMVPFTYMVVRLARADTSAGGVAVGVLMVGTLLIFLAALGITLSTLLRNVLVALVVLLAVIVASGFVLQFLGLTWMSTTAVLYELPETFRGQTPVWDQVRVLAVFSALTAVASASSLWIFRRRDL